MDAKRSMYRTEYVRLYSEKGGTLKIDTDLGEGELHGKAVWKDGCYVTELQPGESTLLYRGDVQPAAEFDPEDGNPREEHFWGVKKIRRF